MLRERIFHSLAFTLLLLTALSSCEHTEKQSNRTLVFEVQATPISANYSIDGTTYDINCDGTAFLPASPDQAADSLLRPNDLIIQISILGELTQSMLNLDGYRVRTSIQLAGGTINIDHTNQSQLVVSPAGDSLYAVRGEGIISSGSDYFQNISGFFNEVSTFRIITPVTGPPLQQVEQINCRYELSVSF